MTVLLALMLRFRHTWFAAVFFFCGIIVLANLVHYVLFRVLKKKEQQKTGSSWGVQRYLSHPARAIFFLPPHSHLPRSYRRWPVPSM